MRVLVTGYAGFIGSNLTRMLYREIPKEAQILGLDAHTYAARPDWFLDLLSGRPNDRFVEAKVDLHSEPGKVQAVINHFNPTHVYHLAAESHVCRSIDGPSAFLGSNVVGTYNLLEALRKFSPHARLVHVSTDEVYGELQDDDPPFDEGHTLEPNSPYAATKAASDMLVRAWCRTYGLSAVITRCTNNYGPNQHEEKLIPRAILTFLKRGHMTLHGDGSHQREWIHVDDHCRALMLAMEEGQDGEAYCVGGGVRWSNREVVALVASAVEAEADMRDALRVVYTDDRPTDDRRYAVDSSKLRDLGWSCDSSTAHFYAMLRDTVRWYLRRQAA